MKFPHQERVEVVGWIKLVDHVKERVALGLAGLVQVNPR